MENRNKPQLFPNPYPSRPCEVFLCSNKADYYIGRPDGPLSIVFPICRGCLESVFGLLPEELKPLLPVPMNEEVQMPASEAVPPSDGPPHVPGEDTPPSDDNPPQDLPEGMAGIPAEPQAAPEPEVTTEPEAQADRVPCSKCGQLFSSRGVLMHERHCKGASND